MTKLDVPRTASFDDLRVGMVLAYDCNPWLVGTIDKVGRFQATGMSFDGTGFAIGMDGKHGAVVLLRDAPAPPVTVRREDYDALVAANPHPITVNDQRELGDAIRALIDHAEVGS